MNTGLNSESPTDIPRHAVLLTRPEGANTAIILRQRGIDVGNMPVYELVPLNQDDIIGAIPPQPLALGICVSRRAAEVLEGLPVPLSRLAERWIAIGPATAAVLEEAGISIELPNPYTSEGLLTMPALALAQLDHRGVLLCCGEGGRELIADTLKAQGTALRKLPLYRRQRLPYSPEALRSRLEAASALVITSTAALELLTEQTPDGVLAHLHLLTLSQRIAESARALGFASVEHADAPTIQSLMDSICTWYHRSQRSP